MIEAKDPVIVKKSIKALISGITLMFLHMGRASPFKHSFQISERRTGSRNRISRLQSRNFVNIVPACLDKLRNGVVEAHDNVVAVAPLTVVRNGEKLQFVWNDGRMEAIVHSPFTINSSNGALLDPLKLKRALWSLWSALFPSPDSVISEYWPWISWRLIQRFFSTCLAVFGTQSLLTAAGIGAQQSLTASVAINWMVRDGIGRICRLVIATKYSKTFDTNIKRARILSMLFYAVCVSGDYLSPVFPNCFLLLTAIANIGKAVAFTAFISTAPSLSIVFADSVNLADVTAKHQAQYSVVDALAIAVAVLSTHLTCKSPTAIALLPYVAYGVCSFFSLYTLVQECKVIVFRTLNEDRLIHVTHDWVKTRTTPSPQKVAEEESSILFNLFGRKEQTKIKIGRLEDMVESPEDLKLMLLRHQEDAFYIAFHRGSHPSAILVTFKEGHHSRDSLLAFLAATFAAQRLEQTITRSRLEIDQILERSVQVAKKEFNSFEESLISRGWDLNSVSIHLTDVYQH